MSLVGCAVALQAYQPEVVQGVTNVVTGKVKQSVGKLASKSDEVVDEIKGKAHEGWVFVLRNLHLENVPVEENKDDTTATTQNAEVAQGVHEEPKEVELKDEVKEEVAVVVVEPKEEAKEVEVEIVEVVREDEEKKEE